MISEIQKLSFDQLAQRYCERQKQTPAGLLIVLQQQLIRFGEITGWFLLECHVLDSSRLGDLAIYPYGPGVTYKEIPTYPISPRGLASDMSIAVAYTLAEELPQNAAFWEEPALPSVARCQVEPSKVRKRRIR